MSTDVVAIVLAGGRCSRMGRDKALLRTTSGERMLDRAVRTARSAIRDAGGSDDSVWISGDYSAFGPSITDRLPGFGPLSGIHAALSFLQERIPTVQLAAFLPVDMPELTPAIISPLIHAAREDASGSGAHYHGHEFPLVLRISAETTRRLAALLDRPIGVEKAPAVAIHRVITELSTLILPWNGADLTFCNLNTSSDFTTWESRHEH